MTAATPTPSGKSTFPREPRQAAEVYLGRGLSPIDLPPRSKDPGYTGWEQLRLTRDDLNIRFPPHLDRNIGILNGQPSGNRIDVDLDVEEALCIADRFLPPTGWAFGHKSSPRSHRIYHIDTALERAQVAFEDIDGTMLLELRGDGGLTLFPPSVHPGGELIEWDRFDDSPGELTLAVLRCQVGKLAAAVILARHWPNEGSRDKAAMALTGWLTRAGWQVEDIEQFVEAVALAAGDDEIKMRSTKGERTAKKVEDGESVTGMPTLVRLVGTSGPEIARRVRQWLGMAHESTPAQAKKPVRPLAPYHPFPVRCLPDPTRDYVSCGAEALGCDPAYIALPSLAVMASLIGNTRVIELKQDWVEPAVVWSLIVGDSGTLKSPGQKLLVNPIFKIQKQYLDDFRARHKDYLRDKAQWERKKKAKGGEDGPGDPPEEPTCRRILCSDTTVEKLAQILCDNPKGVLLWRDELNAWVNSFTRYKGRDGKSDVPHWLEMFRAEPMLVDRKTGDRTTISVPRAAVSVCGGIQPGILARTLSPEFMESGFVARLCLAMPPKSIKRWSEARIDRPVKEAYEKLVEDLVGLEFAMTREDEENAPVRVQLDQAARRRWVAFYNEWATVQAAADSDLASAYAKLEAYAARFALIHHVVTHAKAGGDCDRIGIQSIEAGVELARWFAYEAQRIYTLFGESREERLSRRLVEFIQAQGGSITAGRLRLSNPSRYPTTEHAEQALDALVSAGLAAWRTTPAGPQGGRPTRVCELTLPPSAYETYETYETSVTDETPGGDGTEGAEAGANETPSAYETSLHPTKPHANGTAAKPSIFQGFAENCRYGSPVVTEVSEVLKAPGEESNTREAEAGAGGEVAGPGQVSLAPAYQLVTDQADLSMVLAALTDAEEVGLDIETTGLNPRTDRLRLLSLAMPTCDGGTFCYLIDCSAVDVSPLQGALSQVRVIAHNAPFDLAFLARLGLTPGGAVCTQQLSQIVHGVHQRKGFLTLGQTAERELGIKLAKDLQQSDWSGPLTEDQLGYAALDAAVLLPLRAALDRQSRETGQQRVAEIESACLPALVWLTQSGVPFDLPAWEQLASTAEAEAVELERRLDATAPPRPGYIGEMATWDWDSSVQVKEVLALVGCPVESTEDEDLAALDHPLADLIRQYRDATKRRSTYGTSWKKFVSDGRIYAGWEQLGAKTGRMASRGPNLQNVPTDSTYRRCFVAPPGRLLVKADYSQIELRIAAKVSGDERMLEAYDQGEDLHTLTAQNMTGKAEVTAAERKLAKPVNFGLIYGLGTGSLRKKAKSDYGLDLSEEDARRYRDAFFGTYPGIAQWHQHIRREKATETRTLSGRRVPVDADGFYGGKANYVIQGTGGDGIKLALALLWKRQAEVPGAFPVLVVHDEIVVECDEGQARQVQKWIKTAMVDAMAPLIEPVPVEVEVKVAPTWGG